MHGYGIPLWYDRQAGTATYPALAQDMELDVAIVGAGMVGLNTAWRLRDSGLRVAVFEARRIGRQATGRSTAKVTSQHGARYASLEKKFGRDGAKLYADANQRAVADIAAVCAKLPDRAGLEEKPAYVYARDDSQADELEKEAQAAASLNLPAELVQDAGLPFATTALLRFAGQYQFDPHRYLVGLAELVAERIPIFEESRVTSVEHGEPCRLTVNDRTVRAAHAVVSTQLPIVNDGLFFAKAFPFAHPVAAAPLPQGLSIEGMFISMGSPSHSFRTATKDGQTYLVAAGGEYKTGEEGSGRRMADDLKAFLKERFGIAEVSHLWTNEDFRSMDSVAFVGPASSSEERLLVATGFEAWGITQGKVAADILADRILGRPNPCAGLFEASRTKPLAGGATFALENLKTASHLVGDKLLGSKQVRLEEIPPGGGGIVKGDNGQLAVCRREDGSLGVLSAECTHMGCIVGWNEIDRSWDCPCHGSRFDENGAVISGPAVSPLEPRPKAELKARS